MSKSIRKAFIASIPVMAGYIVLGIGFGLLLSSKGYGALWSLAMSTFIYAGSMQFVAVDFLGGAASLIPAMILITIAIRFAPFVIFHGRQTPEVITYYGKVLPAAIMGMLVIYCLRNTEFAGAEHGIPEIIACAVVVALHKWKRNRLLSIIAGTVVYMMLIRFMV